MNVITYEDAAAMYYRTPERLRENGYWLVGEAEHAEFCGPFAEIGLEPDMPLFILGCPVVVVPYRLSLRFLVQWES